MAQSCNSRYVIYDISSVFDLRMAMNLIMWVNKKL